MRYFLRLAYNGAKYCGWQRQPNAVSVQQVIEESLATMLRTPTPIVGAGRTDAGVHAACMYAHLDTSQPIEDEVAFIRSLNHLCGRDIAIYDIYPVHEDAHARFDATARTYKYVISQQKSPFAYPYSWQLQFPLDIEAMNRAAAMLLNVSDFTSFAKLHTDVKTNICKVSKAEWSRGADNTLIFTIRADRFLRNMVRAVVGTLVEVGRGKMNLEQFLAVIEAKDRCAAGNSVPAQGLFLHHIEYPYPLVSNRLETKA